MFKSTAVTLLCYYLFGSSSLVVVVNAWTSSAFSQRKKCHGAFVLGPLHENNNNNNEKSWSITDDWSAMSEAENRPVQGGDIFQQDVVDRAAQRLQAGQKDTHTTAEWSAAEAWLHTSIGKILNPDENNNSNEKGVLAQVDLEDYQRTLREEMEGNQVARLVRCQEVPQAMLISQGRAVADLTWEQAHDVRQLLVYNITEKWWQATEFLHQAVDTLFAAHCTTNDSKQEEEQQQLWDASAVSAWMRQSLQEPCGKHDPRVLTVLSGFGRQGFLDRQGLQDLYVHAVVGDKPRNNNNDEEEDTRPLSPTQIDLSLNRFMTQDAVLAVWRDLKRHGVQSPAERQHAQAVKALETDQTTSTTFTMTTTATNPELFMDECEIIDDAIPDGWYKDDVTGTWQRHGKSSHEKVALAADQKTPLYLQDGDYVYIDEESCIGCTQCALAAPASFQMLDNGRARTFLQRGRIPDVQAAVKTCPVNCMHYVDFARLVTLEQARDSVNGDDGRTDHRHFGRDRRNGNKWRTHTPLYVSRMESSDANHKDSLYHYVKRQCYQSNQCPSRGCYDCPLHANNPEANPHLRENRKQAQHMRAHTFQENGIADSHRRRADL